MPKRTTEQRLDEEKASFKAALASELSNLENHIKALDKAWFGFDPSKPEKLETALKAEQLRSILWDRYLKLMELASNL